MKRAVVKLEVLVSVVAPDDVVERLGTEYEDELDLWRDLAVGCVRECETYNGTDPGKAEDEYPRGWVELTPDVMDEEMYEGPEDL